MLSFVWILTQHDLEQRVGHVAESRWKEASGHLHSPAIPCCSSTYSVHILFPLKVII